MDSHSQPEMIFKNFQNEEIKDPREEYSANTIPNYKAHHIPTHSFVAECKGPRPTQEDQFIIDSLEDFNLLTETQKGNALTDAIVLTQSEMKKTELGKSDIGSTLNVVILNNHSIFTASVGDSTAFLVVRDQQNNIVEFCLLNKVLHHIYHSNVDKLISQGLKIDRMYLRVIDQSGYVRLNLYRSMGDFHLIASGFSALPDIYRNVVTIPENGNAFVINACDGLTERATHSALKTFLQKNSQLSLEELPEALTRFAYQTHSADNVTVIVSPIEEGVTKLLGVFDGHNGDKVAIYLKENFKKNLSNQILFYKNLNAVMADKKKVEDEQQALKEETEKKSLAIIYEKILEIQRQIDGALLPTNFYQINTAFLETLNNCLSYEAKHEKCQTFLNLLVRLNDYIEINKLSIESFSLQQNIHQEIYKREFIIKFSNLKTLFIGASVNLNEAPPFIQCLDENIKGVSVFYLSLIQHLSTQFLNENFKYHAILQKIVNLQKEFEMMLETKQFVISNLKTHIAEFDKVLCLAYLETYKLSRYKSFFAAHYQPADKVARLLEQMLIIKFSEINQSNFFPAHIKSLTHKLIWLIAKKYPEFVDATYEEMKILVADEKTDANKKLFINTGKMLQKMGGKGFRQCSMFFSDNKTEDTRFSERLMVGYYKKH